MFKGKLSALKHASKALAKDWTGPTGLVIDDMNSTDGHPKQFGPMLRMLQQNYRGTGVVGMGSFAYAKKANSLHEVTLRVFVFDSVESCRKWWQKKYQYEGWEKHYKPVTSVPYRALDSTQMSKRAVSFGNVWMTCGHIFDTQDHLTILNLYVKAIEDRMSGKLHE